MPEPGGWYEQDSFLVWGLDVVFDAKAAKEAEENDRSRKRR